MSMGLKVKPDLSSCMTSLVSGIEREYPKATILGVVVNPRDGIRAFPPWNYAADIYRTFKVEGRIRALRITGREYVEVGKCGVMFVRPEDEFISYRYGDYSPQRTFEQAISEEENEEGYGGDYDGAY